YSLSGKYLGSAGLRPSQSGDLAEDRRQKRNGILLGAGALLAVGVVAWLNQAGVIELTAEAISNGLGWVLLVVSALVFGWLALGPKEPSIPAKFSIALLLGALAFAILVPAAGGRLVSPWWLTATYFLQTLGELFLSPVGLSAMTKLAPQRVAGFMMGVWFLS